MFSTELRSFSPANGETPVRLVPETTGHMLMTSLRTRNPHRKTHWYSAPWNTFNNENKSKKIYPPQICNDSNWPRRMKKRIWKEVLYEGKINIKSRRYSTRCRLLLRRGSDWQFLVPQIPVCHICSIEHHRVWSAPRCRSHRFVSDPRGSPPWGCYQAGERI